MIKQCQGLGSPCNGEGFYKIFYRPGFTLNGAGWLCNNCASILKDTGATVIDKKQGLPINKAS